MTFQRSRSAIVLRAAAPAVLLILAGYILLRFPPSEFSFYPRCPIYQYLHLQCPGCGTTRALAALLRGHLTEALRFNALTTLAIPFAAVYAVIGLRGESLHWPRLSSAGIYAALAVAAVFTVMRNLRML